MLTGVASFVDSTHVSGDQFAFGTMQYESDLHPDCDGQLPAVSPLVPINGRNIINSDQVLSMPVIPKTLIVVGGGVIGVEYTCMFATLGVRVILVEKRPRLLEFADNEMVEALSYHLRDVRCTMRLNEEVARVEETPEGVVATLIATRKYMAMRCSMRWDVKVTWTNSIWRRRHRIDSRGRIKVGCRLPHEAVNIFAAGRRDRLLSLASVSMEQGRIAAGRAFQLPLQSHPPPIPMAFKRSRRFRLSARPRSN